MPRRRSHPNSHALVTNMPVRHLPSWPRWGAGRVSAVCDDGTVLVEFWVGWTHIIQGPAADFEPLALPSVEPTVNRWINGAA